MLSYLRWIFVCLTGVIALVYGGKFAFPLHTYLVVGTPVATAVAEWEVKEISSSEYGFQATYFYVFEGKTYKGKTLFEEPVYLNAFAAQADKGHWEGQKWKAWVDPAHPEVSTLQRRFPSKALVHALLTAGVFIYFLILMRIKKI